ncbi:hypothetical protein BGZ81_002513 [Podila clonocystis]|nr:hypothetical protein BGZ81_002513 [Podila clonocystis]
MSPLPLVRPIGNLERYSVSRTNAGLYYNVVVGTRLQLLPGTQGSQTAPKDPAQWLKLLTGPLTWLVQKHPSLSVVIGDHLSSHPTFLRMPSVDLSKIVRVTSIDRSHDIPKVLEEEHAKPFDFTNHDVPLWRIVVAHVAEDDSFYLLYAFGHMIADGRSGVALTEQLVERLNYEATIAPPTEALSTTVVSPTDPLPEPLEKRANCYPSIPTLVKEAVSALLLPPFIKKAFEKKYWAASVFATKAVFLSNKSNDKELSTTDDMLVFTSPVATRPLLTPPIDKYDQGSYTSEIVTRDIVIQLETSFWDLSKRLRDQIVQGTQTPGGVRELLEHIGLLQFVPNHQGGWEEFLRSKVTKEQHGRGTTLELSNVGRAWDQPKDDKAMVFKVQEGVFSQSAMITGPALMLNAATANGVLTMVGTWQRAAFSGRERGETMLNEFKRILLQATEPGKEEFVFREALGA